MPFTNLAFKGGGVLGIAYAGAIQVIENAGIMTGIEKVAGTSAGAITALLVSLNYSAADVKNIVNGTNFRTFQDGFDPLRIATKFGLYSGNALLSFIQTNITNKGLAANATFTDLKNAGFKDLHVFATDLNEEGLKEFSFATTPTTIVAEAVRASMAIPLFFEAWQFSNSIPDDHIYVDGGTIYNYPLTAFDTDGVANTGTLGFYLTDLHNAGPDNDLGFRDIFKYARVLFETLMDAQDIDFLKDLSNLVRTVRIDDFGISATDFNITAEQETALYQSGIDGTTTYINNLKPPTLPA